MSDLPPPPQPPPLKCITYLMYYPKKLPSISSSLIVKGITSVTQERFGKVGATRECAYNYHLYTIIKYSPFPESHDSILVVLDFLTNNNNYLTVTSFLVVLCWKQKSNKQN